MLDWIILGIGGLCEVGFVVMMKLSNGFKKWKYITLMLLFMAISFFSLSIAFQTIPMGIAYAVWVAIGAIGSVIVGMLFFNESKSKNKLFFISLIIIGIVGLKISTI